jgi:hypothetical protein
MGDFIATELATKASFFTRNGGVPFLRPHWRTGQ